MVTDRKLPVADQTDPTKVAYFTADVVSYSDYLPFGQIMPNRHGSEGFYRYSFNTQEKVDEISGEGNHTTAMFWEYDTRLARRWNLDPKAQISISDYSVLGANPILFNDILGDTWRDKNGKEIKKDNLTKIKVYIFYDPTKNGEHGGFGEQTLKQLNYYEKKYGKGSVAISAVGDVKTFKEDWSNMAGRPAIVAINMHGSNQALHINADRGEYLSSNETGKTNSSGTKAFEIKDLPSSKANFHNTMLQLNSCSSDDHFAFKHGSKGSNLTVAESFRKYYDFSSVRTSGFLPVNYWSNGQPHPAVGSWNYLIRGHIPVAERKETMRDRMIKLEQYGPKY